MTSPVRSVAVRLSMDPSSYIAGAAKAERSTLALDKAVRDVGPHTGSSMEKAAAGAGKAEGAFGKAKQSAGALGLTLGGLAGASAAVAVGMSVKWAGDYQSALTKLATTAGESQKNLKSVGQGMLDMAGQVGIGADELAKGMYTIDSAGIHGADSLVVLKAAAQGARQEQADLGHVVDAVTTSLHDYHLPASDAAKVTSQLIAAVSNGKTTFDELTGAMHSVEPIAASAGMTIAQTAGALAAMTASGMHADQAAQNLASSIRSFEKPTSTMRDELYQLGLDAQDLTAHLGQRGIAGTLQLVSDAIVQKMGPAGQVALSALNQNKAAARDLVVMMQSMTPEVAKLSSGLLDGSVSVSAYSKAAKSLGGEQAAMALQFLGLYKSSAGFSQILKSGGPAVQTYIGALGKAVGTSEGLSVALQLTGENAAGTNKAIGAVAKAAGDAKGNIQGWDEVQGNFNQRLAEAEAGAKSLAIEAGQHLLPVLTNGLGWIHDNGPAALHALSTGFETAAAAAKPLIEVGGGAVKAFQALPGPIQETVLALVALRGASAMGWMSGIGSIASKAQTAFAGFNKEVGATSLGAAAASRSMGALKSAGSGVVNMLGGPWMMALEGGALAVAAQQSAIDDWAKALQAGGDAAAQATAQMQAQAQPVRSLGGLWAGITGGFKEGISQLEGYSGSLDQATQKAKAMHDALSPMARAQQDVTTETANADRAVGIYGVHSEQAKEAIWRLSLATGDVATQQALMDSATRGANGALSSQLTLSNELSRAGLSLDQANLSATQSIDQYKASLKDANLKENDRRRALDDVSQSIFGVMDAAKQKADAETKGLPVAQVTNQEIVRQRDALNAVVKQLGFVPPALKDMYDRLNGPTSKALVAAKTHVDDMGTSMTTVAKSDVPGLMTALAGLAKATGHTVPQSITGGFLPAIDGAGAHAVITGKKVFGLGTIIDGLPLGHNTVITADTGPADKTILAFMKKVQADGFVGALYNLTPTGRGTMTSGGRPGLPPVPGKATGGAITGPGSGTSDSVLIAASNGEHMWTAAETRAAGGHAGVEALRKAVLAAGHGLAGGGAVPTGMSYPVDFSSASKAAMTNAYIRAQSAAAAAGNGFAGGAPSNPSGNAAIVQRVANNYGWGSGAEWNALYNVIMRESGFRNTAQNPTSTAYGMFQFLDSTWAGYGVSKTSSPLFQSVAGLSYIHGRYGDPLGALRHEQSYGWYDNGGWLKPGMNIAMNGTGRPERVRTFEQEAVVQKQLRSSERAGGSSSSGTPTPVVVKITGARLSGRLEMGTDGLFTLVNGQIDQAFSDSHDLIHNATGH